MAVERSAPVESKKPETTGSGAPQAPSTQGNSAATARTTGSTGSARTQRDDGPSRRPAGADNVNLSHDDDDDDGPATPRLSFMSDQDEMREIRRQQREAQAADRADGKWTESDGTKVEEKDGRTTRTRTDGSVQVTYREGDKSVTEESYVRDGARVKDIEWRSDDGDVRTQSTVEKDGIVETTTSTKTKRDGRLEDIVCGVGPEARDNELVKDGKRDQVEVTTVTRTVTDTTKQPPETREVLDRTTYSQHIPLGDKDPAEAGIAPPNKHYRRGAYTPGSRYYEDASIDRDRSGVTLAYSTETSVDEKGERHTTTETGITRTIEGTNKDGKPLLIAQTDVELNRDGKRQIIEGKEMKGVYGKDQDGAMDVRGAGDLDEKDDHYDRMPDGWMDYRETHVYDVDREGERKEVASSQEYGSYDKPDEPGRTVTITQQGDAKYWTYNQVDGTDDGVRIRTHTAREGTEGYVQTDGYKNRDGTFKTETGYYEKPGMPPVRTERQQRTLVGPEEFSPLEGDYWGNLDYSKDFVAGNEGRKMYKDEVYVSDARPDNRQDNLRVQQYTAEGSDDKVTVIVKPDENGDSHGTTIFEDAGSDRPARMRTDLGPEYYVDKKGKAYVRTEDGQTLEIPPGKDPNTPGAHGAAESSQAAFKNLYGALTNLEARGTTPAIEFADKYPKVSGPLSGISVAVGAAGVYDGIVSRDLGKGLQGGSQVAGGLGEISSLASKAVTSTRMTSALGVGGKVLGGAGVLLGAGYGAYQISQGDYVAGGFSLAAAAGGGVAIGAGIAGVTGWVPVAGWAVAGVAIVGGLVYDLWKADNEAHKTHEIPF